MAKLAKILLVEDSEEDIQILKINFKKQKITNPLEVIRNGEDAIEALSSYKLEDLPDLILLDINLPRYNGKEVLKKIKSDERLSCIPVVMLTTSAADDDVNECYSLGAAGYIRKPVDITGIHSVLGTLSNYWFGVVILPKKNK